MSIQFSAREYMVPGKTTTERFENAARLGLAAIEVTASSRRELLGEIKAASAATGVRASTMSSSSQFVLDARKDERQKAIQAFKDALAMAGEVGALGVIMAPLIAIKMEGGQRLPDLSPLMSTAEVERRLLSAVMAELADCAQACGVEIIIEPLNRYEQWWPCTLQHGVDISRDVGKPGVCVMADFFHMNIEEADMGAAIRAAGALVRDVHLADSHRLWPGTGHTDFRPGFAALKAIGYSQYMAFECGTPGERFAEFAKAMAYLRRIWAEA
jgi:sugar phosphate isomerase/epimerase